MHINRPQRVPGAKKFSIFTLWLQLLLSACNVTPPSKEQPPSKITVVTNMGELQQQVFNTLNTPYFCNVLKHYDAYKQMPWAQEVLDRVKEKLATKDTLSAQDCSDIFTYIDIKDMETTENTTAIERYGLIDSMQNAQLYQLMCHTTDNMSKSFQMYLIDKLIQRNANLLPIIQDNGAEMFGKFLDKIPYSTIDKILPMIADALAQHFIELLEGVYQSKDASRLINLCKKLCTHDEIKTKIAQSINEYYLKNKDDIKGEKNHIYNIVVAALQQYVPGLKMYTEDGDSFSINQSLEQKEFFGADRISHQLMLFYDDDDGRSSYDNTVKFYQNKGRNITEDNKNGKTSITSPVNNDKQIVITIVQPGADEKERASIVQAMKRTNGFVQRGHHGHITKARIQLDSLVADPAVAVIGGCRGQGLAQDAIKTNPHTQFIATEGTGTQSVNLFVLWFIYHRMLTEDDELPWSVLGTALDQHQDQKARLYKLPNDPVQIVNTLKARYNIEVKCGHQPFEQRIYYFGDMQNRPLLD